MHSSRSRGPAATSVTLGGAPQIGYSTRHNEHEHFVRPKPHKPQVQALSECITQSATPPQTCGCRGGAPAADRIRIAAFRCDVKVFHKPHYPSAGSTALFRLAAVICLYPSQATFPEVPDQRFHVEKPGSGDPPATGLFHKPPFSRRGQHVVQYIKRGDWRLLAVSTPWRCFRKLQYAF
jgi:hypothetical protein